MEAIFARSGFAAAEPRSLFKPRAATCICMCFRRTARISLSIARPVSSVRRNFLASLPNRTRAKIKNPSLAMQIIRKIRVAIGALVAALPAAASHSHLNRTRRRIRKA
jgi:hypothetical protein